LAINAFSNLTISVSDGGTVPSLDYLTNKTFVDIGSGNVLKVSWNTPTATNNAVDNYKLTIVRYDSASSSYKSLYSANIGNVNEYYVKSSLFSSLKQSYIPLRIYVEAISKYGTAYNGTSNVKLVSVSKGYGMYTRVTEGYKQPIMKRTLGFAKLDYLTLADATGKAITAADGEVLYGKASSVQDDTTGWTLMQEFYSKAADGSWQSSDIAYEALTDSNGEVVTDINSDIVYVL
jgi:hypothetical protein